jgi:putative heme-binding domain-containing protein
LPDALRDEAIRQAQHALKNRATTEPAFIVLNSFPTERTDAFLIDSLPDLERGDLHRRILSALLPRSTHMNFEALINLLPTLPPQSQNQILIAATRSRSQRDWLFTRIESDAEFRSTLGLAFINGLRNHSEETVRIWAAEHLSPPPAETTLSQKLAHYESALQIEGNAKLGRAIYDLRCAVCHRAGNEGPDIGPDLVTVSRAGRESLLNNILAPNREINPAYETWQIKLKDGTEWIGKRGMQMNDGFPLHLADGSVMQIRQAEITSVHPTGQSLMPEGLAEGLTLEAMANLLRFIEELAISDVEFFTE